MALELASLGGETMGTTWRVHMALPRRTDLRTHHSRIDAVLSRIVAQMSTWEVESNISLFNSAEAGSSHSLPGDFERVLSCALEISKVSKGAFDPTVGELVGIWGFGANARRPDHIGLDTEVIEARRHVGWEAITIKQHSIRQPGGIHLDLSAIAKGYSSDAISESLQEAGINNSLVEVGGELRAAGRKPDGSPWRISVEDAESSDSATPRVIALGEQGVASSGDRWHFNELDNRRVTHTLDPRTGVPVQSRPMTVTVIAASAMLADAWATAMRVLGPAEGLTLAESQGLAVRFHWLEDGHANEAMTDTFKTYLTA